MKLEETGESLVFLTITEKFDELRDVAKSVIAYHERSRVGEVWPSEVIDLECVLQEINILERKFERERKNSEALEAARVQPDDAPKE